MVVALGEELE